MAWIGADVIKRIKEAISWILIAACECELGLRITGRVWARIPELAERERVAD